MCTIHAILKSPKKGTNYTSRKYSHSKMSAHVLQATKMEIGDISYLMFPFQIILPKNQSHFSMYKKKKKNRKEKPK